MISFIDVVLNTEHCDAPLVGVRYPDFHLVDPDESTKVVPDCRFCVKNYILRIRLSLPIFFFIFILFSTVMWAS